jgi:DnaJ-class molecular chaperone
MGKVKDIFQDQRERASVVCPECDGDGKVVEVTYRVQSFDRDIGEPYEDRCQGEGAIFEEENDEDL